MNDAAQSSLTSQEVKQHMIVDIDDDRKPEEGTLHLRSKAQEEDANLSDELSPFTPGEFVLFPLNTLT